MCVLSLVCLERESKTQKGPSNDEETDDEAVGYYYENCESSIDVRRLDFERFAFHLQAQTKVAHLTHLSVSLRISLARKEVGVSVTRETEKENQAEKIGCSNTENSSP